MLSPKIFTNLHIIMYILILDFQLVMGWGRNVYLHIGQIMQGSLSLTNCGKKKFAFVLVIQNVHWRLSSKPPNC